MSACHTKAFVLPGVVVDTRGGHADDTPTHISTTESCDYCGSPRLEWRKCKLICAECRQINKSCADL